MVRYCGGASIAEAKAAIKNHPDCILSLYPDEGSSTKTVFVATKGWWKNNGSVVGIKLNEIMSKVTVTASEAEEIIARNSDGGAHTFVNPTIGVLIGADHTKEEIDAEIKNAKDLQIGGDECRRLSHQLVIDVDGHRYFVATDDEKVDQLIERKNHA